MAVERRRWGNKARVEFAIGKAAHPQGLVARCHGDLSRCETTGPVDSVCGGATRWEPPPWPWGHAGPILPGPTEAMQDLGRQPQLLDLNPFVPRVSLLDRAGTEHDGGDTGDGDP